MVQKINEYFEAEKHLSSFRYIAVLANMDVNMNYVISKVAEARNLNEAILSDYFNAKISSTQMSERIDRLMYNK